MMLALGQRHQRRRGTCRTPQGWARTKQTAAAPRTDPLPELAARPPPLITKAQGDTPRPRGVEMAPCPTEVAIRDSKAPDDAALAFRFGPFAAFIEVLKADTSRTAA